MKFRGSENALHSERGLRPILWRIHLIVDNVEVDGERVGVESWLASVMVWSFIHDHKWRVEFLGGFFLQSLE